MDTKFDGVIKSDLKFQDHEERVYHRITQPTEDLILERNHELRKTPGVLRDLSFGRQVASIPMVMYVKAIKDGYMLNSPDSEIASKEMMRFLQSEEGKLCLVQ